MTSLKATVVCTSPEVPPASVQFSGAVSSAYLGEGVAALLSILAHVVLALTFPVVVGRDAVSVFVAAVLELARPAFVCCQAGGGVPGSIVATLSCSVPAPAARLQGVFGFEFFPFVSGVLPTAETVLRAPASFAGAALGETEGTTTQIVPH